MSPSVIRRAVLAAVASLAIPAVAAAQVPSDSTWSAEASVGWAFPAGGNVLSSGIGTIFDRATVIEDQSYGDIFGTGVRVNLGGGYRLDDMAEVRGELSIDSAGAELRRIGSSGPSALYATLDDYRAVSIEGGYRRYFADASERMRPYGGATIGLAILPDINADLAVPDADASVAALPFYDGGAALTFGVNGGVLYALTDRVDVKGQIGIRHIGGMAEGEGLAGTGLENINDSSSRWTVPLTVGVRYRF